MKKRMISIILSILIISVMMPYSAFADNSFNVKDAAVTPDPAEIASQTKARELIDRYADLEADRDVNVFTNDIYPGEYRLISESQLSILADFAGTATANCSTDYQKIHAVYAFVAKNMFYNCRLPEPVNVYNAWQIKYGTSRDYADLCKVFLNSLDIPCRTILSNESGATTDKHTYNAAYDGQNKRWIYFDACCSSYNKYDGINWENIKMTPSSNSAWFEASSCDEEYFDMPINKTAALAHHEITTIDNLTDGDFCYRAIKVGSNWFDIDKWEMAAVGIKPGSKTSAKIADELDGLKTTTILSSFKANHYPELKEIIIPDTVTTIYSRAFDSKYPIIIRMLGDPPTSCYKTAFDHMADGSIVYFPCTNSKWTDKVVDSFDVYYPGPDLIRDHDKNSVVSRKEPTATTDGYIEYECSKCGKTYKEIVPATGEADEPEKPSYDDEEGEEVEEEIIVKDNPMKVTKKNKTYKYSGVKKEAKTYKAITVRNAKGKVKYKVKGGDTKALTLKKGGKITVKKGTGKGKYKLKIKVTASGTDEPDNSKLYLSQSKTVTVTVTIK